MITLILYQAPRPTVKARRIQHRAISIILAASATQHKALASTYLLSRCYGTVQATTPFSRN